MGGNATPAGLARRACGRKGGSRLSPLGGASQHLIIPGPTDKIHGQPTRQTNQSWGGQEAECLGRVAGCASCLNAPGRPRAARTDPWLSHRLISALVGRGGGSAAAGRPDARWAPLQVTRGSHPGLCDHMQSPQEGTNPMPDDS